MAGAQREFGIVGLGRMGGGLAHQALDKGIRVIGMDVSAAPDALVRAGLNEVQAFDGLRSLLARPRVVFVYVPAGRIVDEVLESLTEALEPGDVIVDGGNSYWGDTIRRARRVANRGLGLVDLGTSGGVEGARNGACFMAGGERDAVAHVEPLLQELAVEGGFVYAGPSGAGHFVKLVHNGIEFGMLQAIAEGVDLLERFHQALPVQDVLRCWRHGSVIRSWLIDLMEQQYREHGGMHDVPPYVEDTGEVSWLVADAMQMECPVPVIAASIMQLFASRDDSRRWARAIAMMRHSFGEHPFGKDPRIREERTHGRVGDIWRPSTPAPARPWRR
jgi:6-phosphogluconate dehydrogenase